MEYCILSTSIMTGPTLYSPVGMCRDVKSYPLSEKENMMFLIPNMVIVSGHTVLVCMSVAWLACKICTIIHFYIGLLGNTKLPYMTQKHTHAYENMYVAFLELIIN